MAGSGGSRHRAAIDPTEKSGGRTSGGPAAPEFTLGGDGPGFCAGQHPAGLLSGGWLGASV